MKIRQVSLFPLDMQLAVPYTIAYETVSQTTNVILRIDTDTGLSGWGCAAPDHAVTGESWEDVMAAAGSVVNELLVDHNPFRISWLTRELRRLLPRAPATIAMVDMALHDLLARRAGLPLYQLLGGYRHSIATSVTIGIAELDLTLAMAEKHLSNGFSILKLKGGIDLEDDVEKVLKLRERFGRDFSLRFDANQGYSSTQSIEFISRVKKASVEIFEQPTDRKKDDSLGRVTQSIPVPVMADESIKTLKDAFYLAANDLIDMINIKLMKIGGIFESLHINSVAKAAGMEVMIGCLDESALGISAGLHFALSRANIEFADLDGHLDLVNDPFQGLFHLRDGVLYPADAPGLGTISSRINF